MSTNTLGLFLRHLALSEEVGRLGARSDRELLASYEAERGQAAFTELMRRHGPMVLRTCRRVLGNGPDAEDAFQATFILLATKVTQLRCEAEKPLSLGGWLHRVAYRTSVNVLTGVTRRRTREREAGPANHAHLDPATEATWNEVRPILDAELDALPREARKLLIACYLEGKSHAQAAAELRVPLGSMAWRLEKARALLAERLAQRGITVSAALVAVLLGEAARGAGVPAVLLVHTVAAALTFADLAGEAVSVPVAQLVKAGLASMAKGWVHGSVVAVSVSLLGVALITCQALRVHADRAPAEQRAAEQAAPTEHGSTVTDRYGDPLPRGALARLGTLRLRTVPGGQRAVLFTPDGRGIITAGRGNPTCLWDRSTGKLVRQFGDGAGHPAYAVVLSPDGRILGGRGGSKGGLCVWEIATGRLVTEGRGGPADTVCLAFSPDGKLITSGGSDGKLRLWDAASGAERWVQNSGSGAILAVAFGRDGTTLTTVDSNAIRVWDVPAGKTEARWWHCERQLLGAAFAPDGGTVAVSCGHRPRDHDLKHVVALVDLATLKEVKTLAPERRDRLQMEPFQSLAVAPDSKVLAIATGQGAVCLWDMSTGKELQRQAGLSFPNALAFSADGSMLAGLDRGLVRVWETASGKDVSPVLKGHGHGIASVAFTPEGEDLISSGWDGAVRLWDTATGQERRRLMPARPVRADYELVGAAAMAAADRKTLVALDVAWPLKPGAFGVTVRYWDKHTGHERSRWFKEIDEMPPETALSPDGKLVACAPHLSEERYIWETATGKLLAQFSGHTPAFSPDSMLLATICGGSRERVLSLREAATGRELCAISMGEGAVNSLTFSTDGTMLATVTAAGTRNTVHVWPLIRDASRPSSSGLRIDKPRVLAEVQFPVSHLAFSPDGRTMALPGPDGTVHLLETATGKERVRYAGHLGRVESLAFSPDGRRLASGSRDTTILIWDLSVGSLP